MKNWSNKFWFYAVLIICVAALPRPLCVCGSHVRRLQLSFHHHRGTVNGTGTTGYQINWCAACFCTVLTSTRKDEIPVHGYGPSFSVLVVLVSRKLKSTFLT